MHGLGGGGGGGRPAGPAGAGGAGGGSPDCKTQMAEYWNKVPMFNRFVLVTCLTVYLVSFIFPQIIMATILMPYQMITFQGKFFNIFLIFSIIFSTNHM